MGGFKVPLISFVQAGLWHMEGDGGMRGDNGDFEYIFTDLPLSPSAFALKVKGDSMEPEFKEGDRIIVDPEVCPSPGDYVVAMNENDEVTFKKYRLRGTVNGQESFELVPLNTDYPTLNSLHNKITILGTMLEHRRYRKRQH
ncbi:putative HTH-type transcriptional regulator [compost metagenome]